MTFGKVGCSLKIKNIVDLYYMKQEKKMSGFTLIELSIVLIIIGLVVGGIVAARGVVESSKINA